MDKLSVIGELAAGIAHEIRNPLTTIKGFTKFLRQEIKTESRDFVDVIESEIDRINFIVSEFMTLAKPHMLEQKEHNLVSLIKTTVSLLESEVLKEGKQIYTDIPYEKVLVVCEENQIKQVFVNIIKNAVESMKHSGVILVAVSINRNYVEISFQDEGIGMPKEILTKLGEPFFTTKENGN